MGAGMGPGGVGAYGQNRATLHLHGGLTPWISDGTPHQWTVPIGDGNIYQKGVSTRDVPDMAASGQGSMTFYYTNQQSNRLMFYHDHAPGITRLNVYAGEAAGYLLVDPYQEDLINGTNNTGINPTSAKAIPDQADLGPLYKCGVPLIIQDKTFVPADIDPKGKGRQFWPRRSPPLLTQVACIYTLTPSDNTVPAGLLMQINKRVCESIKSPSLAAVLHRRQRWFCAPPLAHLP